MLYLAPENRSSLGEDTFWTWMAREFPAASFELPAKLGERDVVLQYSTLGPCKVPGGKKVALLWELYPEMEYRGIAGDWRAKLEAIHACAAASDYRTVASTVMAPFYGHHGPLHELPIGVDGDLFAPRPGARWRVRAELGIKQDVTVGLWCGTRHQMKGFDRLQLYAATCPDFKWIVVSKTERQAVKLPGHVNLAQVSQQRLSDLMNAADFFLLTSRLQPYFMVEWEAMACDLQVVNMSGLEKDFHPDGSPRLEVEGRGWMRTQARETWRRFLTQTVGAEI